MSGQMFREKATQTALHLGREFSPTDDWLNRWKKNHNIVFRREQQAQAAERWKEEVLPAILQSYAPKDVYNADETGLVFRGLPGRGHMHLPQRD